MNARNNTPPRILAIHPDYRGFGFVVLEGVTNVIDWGARTIQRDKNRGARDKARELIRLYRPETIVVQRSSRGTRQAVTCITTLRRLARTTGVGFRTITRQDVRQFFLRFDAPTKREIAAFIATQFTELSPYLPPPRKPWMAEHYRMAIFDATAVALAYFHSADL